MYKKQVTLADLARELGISTATVSRALKDYPDISADTKRRVLELAKAWNYRPNTMAAGLRKRESKVIGVIVPSIVNHFFSSVIKGIMEVAYDKDYRVMLCQSDESYEKEVKDAYTLLSSRVDGLLVSLAHQTDQYDHFDAFMETGIPVVFFDKIPENYAGISTVTVDDFGGAYEAVTHLIKQECKNIAHFRGPLLAYTSRNRYEGYKKALKDHNLTEQEDLIFSCEEITFEEGREFAKRVVETRPDCDAIFCVTDSVAMGAMSYLKEIGKVVPKDIAVIGFSNWQISMIVDPPLSSVAQPSLEMGRMAIELLLQEIQSEKNETPFDHQDIVLPTSLALRASSQRTDS